MTESLLERSARYIDEGAYEGPRSVNLLDGSFHELADGLTITCGSTMWPARSSAWCRERWR